MYRKISNSWLKHWDFILLDLIFLQTAYLLSCYVRNGWENPYHSQIYLNIAIVICLIDICIAFFLEDYRGIMRRGYFQEFKAVLKHVTSVCGLEVGYLFLSQNGQDFSRISFVMFYICSIIFLYLERILWKKFLLKRKKNFYNKRALLVLTSSGIADEVLAKVLNHTYNELEIIGIVLLNRDDRVGETIQGVPIVCKSGEVLSYIQTRWVDSLFINVEQGCAVPGDLRDKCIQMGVTVHSKIAELNKDARNQQLDTLGGYVVLSSSIRMATPRQLFLKRSMDIVGGLVGLVFTGILTVFLGPAIYLSSPGPIFFSQIRVGRNGRRFKIYKFRSMYMDAEERKKELMEKNEMHGFMFKMEADPRIIGSGPDGTRHGLGWFIRKTSIDEFPQFWNILKGDMSLVGTRPPTEDEWDQYEPHHRARLTIKPGLTGMWQVSGRSDITDFEDVIRLDMDYIQHWNVGLDIRILLKTVLVVLTGDGSK